MRALRFLPGMTLIIAVGFAQPAAAWIPPRADLALTKVGQPSAVAPTNNITYTLQLTNAGPDAASGVVLSDPIPGSTTFVSFIQNTGPTFTCTTPAPGTTGVVACTRTSLAAGAVATFTLVVKVDVNATIGSTITNKARVVAATPDLVPSNNSATATTLVISGGG
jgi:uncharacterized repeat protein (TIGR01451 family)